MNLTDEEFLSVMDRLYTSDDPRVDEAFDQLRTYLDLVLTVPATGHKIGPFEQMRDEIRYLHRKFDDLERRCRGRDSKEETYGYNPWLDHQTIPMTAEQYLELQAKGKI